MIRANRKHVISVMLCLVLIVLDQWSKYVAVIRLKSQPPFCIVKNVLELVYVENEGSAWGMLSGMRILLILVTIGLLWYILCLLRKLPEMRQYRNAKVLLLVVLAGGIGNLIDRIRLGKVIDFIYFRFIDFPVFNLADCYVTISIALLVILYRKEIMVWMKNGS